MMESLAARNAMALGAACFLSFFLARSRRAHLWLPLYFCAVLGLSFALRTVDYRFLIESIRYDPPWFSAGVLAVWCALAAAGWLRVRSWWAVVVGSVLVGDYAVAIGLAACESEASRRARLVLAASGASLVGPWSGASAVVFGWGGLEMAALGLLLAGVGFSRGGGLPALVRPDRQSALQAGVVPLWLGLFIWLFMLAGVPDLAAMNIESLPVLMPQGQAVWLGLVATIWGALGAEPGVALLSQDIVVHATQVRSGWLADAFRVGLAIGGGLPMVMAAGGKLTVALPLWVVQVLLALGFLAWRYP